MSFETPSVCAVHELRCCWWRDSLRSRTALHAWARTMKQRILKTIKFYIPELRLYFFTESSVMCLELTPSLLLIHRWLSFVYLRETSFYRLEHDTWLHPTVFSFNVFWEYMTVIDAKLQSVVTSRDLSVRSTLQSRRNGSDTPACHNMSRSCRPHMTAAWIMIVHVRSCSAVPSSDVHPPQPSPILWPLTTKQKNTS